MARIETTDYSTPSGIAPNCKAEGEVTGSLFAPEDSVLWSASEQLAAGAALVWDESHGDEAVFVLRGTIAVGGEACDAGDMVVVEAGVPTRVEARTDASILHFGPKAPEPAMNGLLGSPALDNHAVHVVRGTGLAVHGFGEPHEAGERITYAEGDCPTCRLTLFSVAAKGGYRTPSHTHSEDEIIHVLAGELQVGRITLGSGMAISVPNLQRYGFTASSDFLYLNYRRDASNFVGAPGSDPILETTMRSWQPESIIRYTEAAGSR